MISFKALALMSFFFIFLLFSRSSFNALETISTSLAFVIPKTENRHNSDANSANSPLSQALNTTPGKAVFELLLAPPTVKNNNNKFAKDAFLDIAGQLMALY